MNWKTLLPIVVITLVLVSSCRKDVVDTDSELKLSFSTDTLTFDTVFTTLASTTLYFKVYNNNKNAVKTNVRLAGGEASNFRINADGIPGDQQGLEIYGKDSTYVFVEVTVDPNGMNTPIIITDSVIFETNGNRQKVILAAWGQNAVYYNKATITTTTWNNTLPIVIFNYAVVDSGSTLRIEQGTQIYMGGNAQFVVYGTGKLEVEGTKDNPVTFQGVRLEDFYDDLPGQWAGIFILRGSNNNSINYAVIKNSEYGVNLGSLPGDVRLDSCEQITQLFSGNAPDITIKNTVIQNSFRNGLSGLLSIINAENCLLFNAGENVVAFRFGGRYNMTHCTLANYGAATINHQTPVLLLTNLIACDQTVYPAVLDARFENTIVYGSLEEEISFDLVDTESVTAIFDHCLLKTQQDDTLEFTECIYNLDPLFSDRAEEDYTIMSNSPCRDSGKLTTVFTDLAGNPRNAPFDIGAYEFSE